MKDNNLDVIFVSLFDQIKTNFISFVMVSKSIEVSLHALKKGGGGGPFVFIFNTRDNNEFRPQVLDKMDIIFPVVVMGFSDVYLFQSQGGDTINVTVIMPLMLDIFSLPLSSFQIFYWTCKVNIDSLSILF